MGLRALGDALAGWSPAGGGRRDPLLGIRAAWPEIVGVDNARAAQPAALANGILTVVTASAGWSHQLAYLEPAIVAGLRALPDGGSVERLRFRVGRLRAPAPGGEGPRGPRHAAGTGPAAPGAAATPEGALERLRRAVERRRAAHAARGGGFCADCAAPIDRGEAQCVPCRDAAAGELRMRLERILFEMPWLPPEEVLGLVPGLDADAYDAIRRRLLRSWWDEMWIARARARVKAPIDPVRLRKIASSFVLLDTRIEPGRLELDSPARRNSLGELYPFVADLEAAAHPERLSRISKDASRGPVTKS